MPHDSIYTLDPTLIACRLRNEVSGTVVCVGDYAQMTVDAFLGADVVEGVVSMAESDARRRGPIWTYRIYRRGVVVRGHVERRSCGFIFENAQPPPEIADELIAFLRALNVPSSIILARNAAGETVLTSFVRVDRLLSTFRARLDMLEKGVTNPTVTNKAFCTQLVVELEKLPSLLDVELRTESTGTRYMVGGKVLATLPPNDESRYDSLK